MLLAKEAQHEVLETGYGWAVPNEPATLPRQRIANYATFGTRVQAALLPVLGSFVGEDAFTWRQEEVAERGEPENLVAALALGHGLVTRIVDLRTREQARHALDRVLHEVKANSLIPPPVSSASRPPRAAELDRCRREK